MTSLATSFGALRSIIQQPPSVISWHRLCDLIDAWPDPEHLQHVALPYAQDILDRTWPDVMRQAPSSWLMRLMQGDEHIQGFELIRRIGRTQKLIGHAPCLELFKLASSEDICRVLSHPQMRHITQLNLRNLNNHADAIAEALSQIQTFEHLTFLNLGGNDCSSEYFASLWSNPTFRHLEQIELWRTKMHDEDVRILAQSPHLSSLRYIELAHTFITARGLEALCRSPYIKEVSELFLSNTQIGDEGIDVITEAPSAVHLENLEVPNCNISEKGAKTLASCAALQNLRKLYIWGNPLQDTGVAHLISSEHLCTLEVLGINKVQVSPYMWVEHANDFRLPNLRDLSLGDQDTVSAASIIALTQTTELKNMTRLSLRESTYTAPAIKALSKALWLPQLKELTLYDRTGTSKATFARMLSTKRFERLETLCIGKLKLRPRDLQCLARNPSMSMLRNLQIINERGMEGGLAHIFCSDVLKLSQLELWACNLDEDDLLAMNHPNMLHMHTLDLLKCTLPNKAFQVMIQSPYLANLVELHVKDCRLDAQSIQAIAKSKTLKGLRVLNLGTHLDQENTRILAQSEHLHPDVRAVFLQSLNTA